MIDPATALALARNRRAAAYENCPHWDYEHDPCRDDYDCCREVHAANAALRRARVRFIRHRGPCPKSR